MRKQTKFIAQGAIIAALYAALTYLQGSLAPWSTSWTIQFRVSEALCVLALFTPAAIPGLAIGCFLYGLNTIGSFPLDAVMGTAASFLAAAGMWFTRKVTVKGYPLLSLLMPGVFNGLLVGWMLTFYFQEFPFWLNALYVAIGEIAVLLTLGTVLFYTIKKRNLERFL